MILREIKNIYIKNRLTEGVDFVRKEWLRSTGGALIGLNYTNNGNYEIELKGKELKAIGTDSSQILGGPFSWSSGLFTIAVNKSTRNLMFASNSGVVYPSAFQEFTLKVTPSENADKLDVDINNTIYQITKKKLSLTRLFYWNSWSNGSQYTEGCAGHLKVDNYCNMYPCILLRSIPRNLDAQCKERVAGDCGMYDSVSGKFYGNVNNTGTFTVEGEVEPENHSGLQQIYQKRLIEGVDYERYDWLKGDGSAYIKGIKYNLWTNRVEMKIGKINVTTIENNEIVYTKSQGNNWAVQQNPTSTTQLLCIFRESGVGVHILEVYSMPSQVTLSFYQNGGYAYCLYNGTEYKGNVLKQSSWDTDIIPVIHSYKMSYIREVLPDGSYHSNLIPCKLLRAITRNLDAQCKERVAGDCGMIDLISGKFYGNVANSGTFTVENDNNE